MRAALERDVPMLAICRGSQVLNVALGGDLEQHVPDRVGTELHREVPGVFSEHDVEVVDGTRLASILGDRHDVKSHHHQGFGALGTGLREAARAPDGTLEALEDPNAPLHSRRPVASRSRRGPSLVRSAGRRGRGVPGLAVALTVLSGSCPASEFGQTKVSRAKQSGSGHETGVCAGLRSSDGAAADCRPSRSLPRLSRGNYRAPIFIDESHATKYLSLLARVSVRRHWRILDWCLLPNHLHLLIRLTDAGLSAGMRELNGCFSRWSNRQTGRTCTGHFLKNRFGSVDVIREGRPVERARIHPPESSPSRPCLPS